MRFYLVGGHDLHDAEEGVRNAWFQSGDYELITTHAVPGRVGNHVIRELRELATEGCAPITVVYQTSLGVLEVTVLTEEANFYSKEGNKICQGWQYTTQFILTTAEGDSLQLLARDLHPVAESATGVILGGIAYLINGETALMTD